MNEGNVVVTNEDIQIVSLKGNARMKSNKEDFINPNSSSLDARNLPEIFRAASKN